MVRASGRLGPLLCWAVVFADLGTSIYYVPGILSGQVGGLASTFVLMTSVAFVLLATKYAEIAARYAEGGGVVTVATEAFGPLVGCLGGMLITVDYFLTSSISSISGLQYLDSLVSIPILPLTIAGLVLLGLLNWVGIKESATVTAYMAIAAFVADLLVLGVVIAQLRGDQWRLIWDSLTAFRGLSVKQGLIGFGSAWLAFSGLESISQLSPAMVEPRKKIANRAMVLITASILITSPLLTAFSTKLLDVQAVNPERYISELGFFAGGTALRVCVVLTATTLLLFASNTAIIGCYHVFLALARQRYLPQAIARRSRRFGTPHYAIAVAVVVPVIILLATRGHMQLLGEMYAFGLLGAFALSSVGLDWVRWREGKRGPLFWLGVLTSVMVLVAWGTNLVHKHLATIFGGAVTVLGMGIAVLVRKGKFDALAGKVGYVSAADAEREAAELPSAVQVVTLAEATDLMPAYKASTLIAVRGVNPVLIEEGRLRAHGHEESAVYVVFVDEIPGIFYPPKMGPSEEAQEVLSEVVRCFEEKKITAIPVWRLAHDAGISIADAAAALGVEAVLVGTSQRTAIWHLLRGNVLKTLIRRLPEKCRLLVCN